MNNLLTPVEQRVVTRALNIIREKQLDYDKSREFNCADVTKNYCTLLLTNQTREQFMVLFLDSQHRLIASEVLFEGTINSASVYPRVIVSKVFEHNAAAVILTHNHPSGVAEPSHADIRLTGDLKRTLATIDVQVLDHIVVGNGRDSETISFAQRGLL